MSKSYIYIYIPFTIKYQERNHNIEYQIKASNNSWPNVKYRITLK